MDFGLVLRDISVTAVIIKSVVRNSEKFHSSYDVPFLEVCIADIERDLVSCTFIQGVLESSCHRNRRVGKLVHCFPEALRLVEKLNDEASSEDSSAAGGNLALTRLDNAVSLSADEHDVLPYIEAAAAQRKARKQNATLNGRFFYSYTAFHFQELQRIDSIACKKRPLIFEDFPLTDVPQTSTSSPPMKSLYVSKISFSFYDPAKKNGPFAALLKTVAERVVIAVRRSLIWRMKRCFRRGQRKEAPRPLLGRAPAGLGTVPTPVPVGLILS